MTGNQIAYWKYAEDARHNTEAESQGRQSLAESARHNRVTEGETTRHNKATEGLSARQIGLGYAQLAETKRANTAREVLQTSQLSETIRSNMAHEVEINRANVAKEAETQRHNMQMETTDINKMNISHSEFQDKLNWDKQYQGMINTPLRVGEGLTNLIGAGLKIGMMGAG